jgi:hypothetical protein
MSFAELSARRPGTYARQDARHRRRGAWTAGDRFWVRRDREEAIVNVVEAEQVRAVFSMYLELHSLLAVVDELRNRG